MLTENILTKKSLQLKGSPLSACFILPFPTLPALIAPTLWVPGMCGKSRQLRWRRKVPAFLAQGNGSLSLLLLSILTWLEARMLLPWIPSSSATNLLACPAPALRLLGSGTSLVLTKALFPPSWFSPGQILGQLYKTQMPDFLSLLSCSTPGSLLSHTTSKMYFSHTSSQLNSQAPTATFPLILSMRQCQAGTASTQLQVYYVRQQVPCPR